MPTPGALALCQPGFEPLLVREAEALGVVATENGPGSVRAGRPEDAEETGAVLRRAAFAHAVLDASGEFSGEKVNELAQRIAGWFSQSLQGERVDAAWPCVFAGAPAVTGLPRRVAAVEAAFLEILGKKLGRITRLATPDKPRVGAARGLFVWFPDFGRAQAGRSAYFTGPARMADDRAAPSRSYLKVEEAYGIVGREPRPGDTVCDLGAAPGGWSYSAAKRGARVVAVDNGPLKGGALGHPMIEHRIADAFGFSPGNGAAFDWLYSDLLEDPHKVIRSIVRPWIEGRWCRRFVINLKFGRVDPIALLGELRAPDSPLAPATDVRIAHLYHDREEFTVMGAVPA
jgi:23S rRNA (cytidine2498-2'-O)-methyltransferase